MGVTELKIEPGTSQNPCRAATHQKVIFDKRSEKSRKVNWMKQRNENNDNNNNNNNIIRSGIRRNIRMWNNYRKKKKDEKKKKVCFTVGVRHSACHRHLLWVEDTIAVATTTYNATVHSSVSCHCTLSASSLYWWGHFSKMRVSYVKKNL